MLERAGLPNELCFLLAAYHLPRRVGRSVIRSGASSHLISAQLEDATDLESEMSVSELR